MVHFGLFLTLFLAYIQNGLALRCWACSSDLDPTCMDPFNASKILQFRNNYQQASGGYNNNPYNNNNNNNNNQYNPYNNQQNNQYGNSNNNNNQFRNDIVSLRDCNDALGQVYATRQVCVKKIMNLPYGKRIVSRECKSAPVNHAIGTCPDRASNIEFCEYCDFDGCNEATGIKAGILAIPCALLLLLRR